MCTKICSNKIVRYEQMIVTFFGHAKVHYGVEVANKLLELLKEKINGQDVTFYLGCYGRFDGVALYSCTKYKETHSNAKLVFVTPYMDDKYLKDRKQNLDIFDEIIYPDLENVPKRYAIVERNHYMIRQADLVIGYVANLASNSRNLKDYTVSQKKPFENLHSQI